MRIAPLAALLFACTQPQEGPDGGPDDAGATDTGARPDAGIGDPSVVVGTFQVQLNPPAGDLPGITSLVGKVYDGPTLSAVIWERSATEGECELLEPRVPFCPDPCGGSALCVEDSTCVSHPKAHSAGKVHVSGLKATTGETELEIEPISNTYQVPAGVLLEYPAFAAGDPIHLRADGDYFPAFELSAPGVAPLELTTAEIRLDRKRPTALAWTPGNGAIHVKLDVSHHGGSKGMISCDTADDGAFEIPAALITGLLDLGVAGYPTIIVTRSTVGSTVIAPGRVELVVSAEIERAVTIAGLTSCTADDACPGDQTCQTDLTCR